MSKQLLEERKRTHGDFKSQFIVAQEIKAVLFANGLTEDPILREAMDQIAHKQSRICVGDANFADHWRDIAGYATLIADMLEGKCGASSST